MKKTLRVALLVITLLGSIAATVNTVKADGGAPQPTCDPVTGRCTQ
jgi:hypothetical protein